MKSIDLKIIKENLNGRDQFITTYTLLKTAINSPKEGGFSVDDMIKRLRLLEKLEAHSSLYEIEEKDFNESMLDRKSVLELEDSDFIKLKELYKGVKWGAIAKTIVDLSNELDSK